MIDIMLATQNQGKAKEIRSIFTEPGVRLHSLPKDLEGMAIEESGNSFMENALIKATAVAGKYDMPALADDSGLEVDALGGEPGILSARYAGPQASDKENVDKLLRALEAEGKVTGSKSRKARFYAAVALVWPNGQILTASGACEGEIATSIRGSSGFGYDPVFIPQGLDVTMAELGEKQKNSLSHRGQALRRLKGLLAQTAN